MKKDVIRERYKRRVEELFDANAKDLEIFKDVLFKACDELCGKNLVRQNGGSTWWWNKDLCKDGCEASKCYTRKLETELIRWWQVQ